MTATIQSKLAAGEIADTNAAIPILKERIRVIGEHLHASFNQSFSIILLTQNHAKQMDEIIQSAWRICEHLFADEKTPKDLSETTSIIAVGGYGREELFPHSDIDLLIISEDAQAYESALSAFVTLLWDCGLKVGHSVRSLEQCIEEAQSNLSVMTSLMESRFLIGNATYHDELTKAVDSDLLWPSNIFFTAKLEEQQARHEKHNDTEYNVEPDVKNSPGGLRDIQTISWVALRHFGIRNFDDLIKFNFITSTELQQLRESFEQLYRVRFALHLIAKRDENRLLFNYQKSVAELLGFEDTLANMAVEKFMQAYYRTALRLSQLNDLMLQHFQSAILKGGTYHQEEVHPINERFELRDGLLSAIDSSIFQTMPSTLLEVFVIFAETKDAMGIDVQTIRAIMENASLIDGAYRKNPEHTTLFIRMFKGKHHLATPMRLMKRYGVLERYMPVFGKIIGMMQFDLFHIYTVDEHTLKVISNTRKLRYETTAEKYPLAHNVFQQLPNKELLYLSALFHDIAKGRGGDHSELGADEAIAFGQLHKLGEWETELIAWLTESHLLMSMTAQRKDISDPEVILQFAKQMGDITNLNYLLCLTVADITATNPELLNDWKAQLLRSLYRSTKEQLLRGLDNPINKKKQVKSKKRSAEDILSSLFSIDDSQAIKAHWETLDDDYFMRETSNDIAWHTAIILNHAHNQDIHSPLINIREAARDQESDNTAQIMIYTQDKPHLFSTIVKTLSKLGISVLDARIISGGTPNTNTPYCINTFVIQDENYAILNDSERQQIISNRLSTNICATESIADFVPALSASRKLKQFDQQTLISITSDIAQKHSILGIKTLDRRGVLSRISDILTQYCLSIHNARITTFGERTEDYFYLTDENGNILSDEVMIDNLVSSLKEVLD